MRYAEIPPEIRAEFSKHLAYGDFMVFRHLDPAILSIKLSSKLSEQAHLKESDRLSPDSLDLIWVAIQNSKTAAKTFLKFQEVAKIAILIEAPSTNDLFARIQRLNFVSVLSKLDFSEGINLCSASDIDTFVNAVEFFVERGISEDSNALEHFKQRLLSLNGTIFIPKVILAAFKAAGSAIMELLQETFVEGEEALNFLEEELEEVNDLLWGLIRAYLVG